MDTSAVSETVRSRALPVRIVGLGLYLPASVETSSDLADRVGRSADWIVSRVGVERRHIADRPVEEIAAAAAREALSGGPPPDLIVNASATPRQAIPDTSVFVQRALGLGGIASYSIHATCLSFVVALHVAATQVVSGGFRRVLVVSSEIGSVRRNMAQPESAALFGDGAAAAVIEATPAGGRVRCCRG